jgi:hypothetical protein
MVDSLNRPPPPADRTAMTASPLTTVLLVAGVALVTWGTMRLASRRSRPAPPAAAPSYARASTIRAERRLDRRPTARGPRDLRCPAGRPQRHPARRPADR